MRPTALFLVTFAFASILLAQTDVHPNHNHDVTDLIDGAIHPELVPDSTAYRLFFVATSLPRDATPEDKAQQKAKLDPIGLNDAEFQVAIGILDQFKADYSDLINTYNIQSAAANDQAVPPDFKSFLERRDLLVQITQDSLRSALSAQSFAHFDTYVQGEKRHMLVNREVQ